LTDIESDVLKLRWQTGSFVFRLGVSQGWGVEPLLTYLLTYDW